MANKTAAIRKNQCSAGGPNGFLGEALRLDKLRELSEQDLVRAQDAAWRWFGEFRSLDKNDCLAWLFSQGSAPKSPEGDCQGMVLGLYGALWLGLVDRAVRLGRLLGGIGWTGKTFDLKTGTGYNRLTTSSRLPMFLAMPTYRFDWVGNEIIGFHFDHKIGPSPLPPGQKVRAIVYARPEYKNPLVLPATRDEIVEIVPGSYLGRILLHKSNRWLLVGYFALRQPVQARVGRVLLRESNCWQTIGYFAPGQPVKARNRIIN